MSCFRGCRRLGWRHIGLCFFTSIVDGHFRRGDFDMGMSLLGRVVDEDEA